MADKKYLIKESTLTNIADSIRDIWFFGGDREDRLTPENMPAEINRRLSACVGSESELAYNSGREAGRNEGYEQGYTSGCEAGRTEGYDQGYTDGSRDVGTSADMQWNNLMDSLAVDVEVSGNPVNVTYVSINRYSGELKTVSDSFDGSGTITALKGSVLSIDGSPGCGVVDGSLLRTIYITNLDYPGSTIYYQVKL